MALEFHKVTATQIPQTNIHYRFCDLFLSAPHILIGGTTGSGKSVLIDDLVYHLITKYSPSKVEFVWIDPKKVSLRKYKNLPHTLRYADEIPDILKALDDVIVTMMDTYTYMQERGLEKDDGTKIVVVIDELADLMVTCKNEVMPKLQRIAQLGRAGNFMLICATQSPSRKVIPAELVLNFDGRVALHCVSPIESRQILNRKGAELLPRYGKALSFMDGAYYEANIPMIPREEINRVIKFWEAQNVAPEPVKATPVVSHIKQPRTSWFGKLFKKEA